LKNKKERDHNYSIKTSIADSGSDGEVLLISTMDSRGATKWVPDSCLTNHMCPHRDWFLTYESLNSGVVLMGNDTQCNVIGIGPVRIRTHDDMVRTLSNVCCIPDPKRNLISVGTLESNGCKYLTEGRVLKISKSTLVLMNRERCGSLYILQSL